MLDTMLCVLLGIQCVLNAGAAIHILSHVDTNIDTKTEQVQSLAYFIFTFGMAIACAVGISRLLERMGTIA